MAFCTKVRDRVQKFFNPEGFDASAFRSTFSLGMMGMMLGELVVFIMLRQSAELGELPYYVTDTLIIGISLIEFLLCPLISWMGSERRRTMMLSWTLVALATTVPLFFLPGPETDPDTGLCSVVTPLRNHPTPTGITWRAAVRLSLLMICGLACALGRLAMMSHGIAYMTDYNHSDNLHMHVGIILLNKILQLVVGLALMKSMTLKWPWLQILLMTLKFLITVLRLHRYPVVAPTTLEKQHSSDRSLTRSLIRVLSNRIVMLQMLAMSLMASAFWGFMMQETEFAMVKYRIVSELEGAMAMITYVPVVLAVLLTGYMYTGPVLPKYDVKAAVRNSGMMCFRMTLLYIFITYWLSCSGGKMAGLELSYNQPACGQNCGCERPWAEFNPVCVPEEMTTYFSPCHAGCTTQDTFNGVGVYSNCTCAPSGRVSMGACDDGSCAQTHAFHQLLVVLATILSSLALVWQLTVIIQTVNTRDVSVAVGLTSGMVSLFAFVGAHGFYRGISTFTCAFRHGPRCLFHNESFVPWVGYTSAGFTGLAMLLSLVTFIILKRQKEPEDPTEEIRLS